jgi:hypothetical protein
MAIQGTTNQNVNTGNRVVIEFGGKQVGLIQSARFSDSYGLDGASGIGDIEVVENVPTKAMYSVSVSAMSIKKNGMRALGIIPENADDALTGVVFDIVVYSKDTGKAVRTNQGCSFDSGDIDINANRIIVTNGQFKSLKVRGTGL